jgi:hypothetical protein
VEGEAGMIVYSDPLTADKLKPLTLNMIIEQGLFAEKTSREDIIFVDDSDCLKDYSLVLEIKTNEKGQKYLRVFNVLDVKTVTFHFFRGDNHYLFYQIPEGYTWKDWAGIER